MTALIHLRRSAALIFAFFLAACGRDSPTSPGSNPEMWLFCINEKRSASNADSEYELGPVTEDAGIREIQELMKDKSLKNPLDAAAVQVAVWEVSDRGGLTDATRQQLRNLPVGP